ncbi:uncharacterized protein LOC141655000 [Silene latifolia]|uniref:uncharacterized protein LOC141655000 n=1 Tax=Silene latifolia TaxID=37657 RepID=UPI003D781EBF
MPDVSSTSSSSYEYFDDPLFLSQSDQPTASLVTTLFGGHDFLGWRREVLMALTSKNKDCFVDGTLVKPPKTDKKYSQWVRCDFMVRQWILNSLVSSIKDSLKYVNSARELWSELLERYGQASALEVYQLKKELEGISQDNASLVDYYAKMKNLWETLDGLDPIPLCSCGKIDQCTCSLLKKIIERENTAKLIQFLMGLNGGYDTVRSQILSMDPLPSINKALGFLQKIERQKQITESVHTISEATAYASYKVPEHKKNPGYSGKTDGNVFANDKYCDHCEKAGHTRATCFGLNKCPHCNKFGHNPLNCFVIKGFPNDKGKGKNKNGFKSGASVSNTATGTAATSSKKTANAADVSGFNSPLDDEVLVASDCSTSTSNANTAGFSSDVLNGIITSVIDQVMQRMSDHQPAGLSSSQFAGIVSHSFASSVHRSFVLNDWIVDTGASDHMTYDLKILTNVVTLKDPIKVGLPDGSVKLVHQMGTVNLTDKLRLFNVFYIPDFKQNLMSVSKLIDHNALSVVFNSTACLFQDLSSKLVIAKGQRVADLYRFYTKNSVINKSISNVIQQLLETRMSSENNKNFCLAAATSSLSLLHSRLGHLSVNKLKFVPGLKAVIKHDFSCETCILAKHHRLPFSICNKRAAACFDMLHIDVWGPYKVPSISGAKYFLTILDDYSRNTWTILFQNKDQVPGLFRDFLAYISNQFNKTVKTVRSDNGTEFLQQYCSGLFKSKGIVHQTSSVGTPQQNGRVERKHRHLLETARALKIQGNLPIKFWGDCILTATYLINLMPSPVIDNNTPFKLIFGTEPVYDNLRVYGCVCYATMPPTFSDKFGNRARKCIFIGYPHNQKGYRLYDVQLHKVFVSRDVVFKEQEFYYTNQQSEDMNISTMSLVNPASSTQILQNQTAEQSTPQDISLSTRSSPVTQSSEATSGDSPPIIIPTEVPVRTSSRPRQLSSWLKDYHCGQKLPAKNSGSANSVAFQAAICSQLQDYDPEYVASLASVMQEHEPYRYSEAQ